MAEAHPGHGGSRGGIARCPAVPGRFRRWRRSRPFWGGLWVVLGGAAILFATLAPLPLIVRQGVAGVSGYLVGALLVAVGVLGWAQSGQRAFLGIAAMTLSLASFVTSNFGGFGFGMAFGVVGGAMLVAWVPAKEGRRRRPRGTATVTGARLDPRGPGTGHADPSPGEGSRSGLCVVTATLALLGHGHPAPGSPASPSARASNASAASVVSPVFRHGAAHPYRSRMRAARLIMRGVRFHGTVTRSTADGPSRQLVLTMDGGRITGGEHRFGRPGGPAIRQRFSSLTLSGGVVMYATRLRFRIGGIGFTFTPTAPPLLPLPAVTATDVEVDGLLIRAAHTDVTGLTQIASAGRRTSRPLTDTW